MKIENLTRAGSINETYQFTDLKSQDSNYKQYGVVLQIGCDPTNCKLSYIHGAGGLAQISKEESKEIIDHCLKQCRGYVIINTTQKEAANKITSLYPTYFFQEVPVGYNNTFQYVFAIKNIIMKNDSCRNPIGNTPITKETIREKLINLLTLKKRKKDYVEEFINSL